MKIKLSEITNAKIIIKDILEEKIPVKLAFKFNKLISKVDAEDTFYIGKMREYIQQYANKDEKGEVAFDESGNFSIPNEKFEEYSKAVKELEEIEVDMDDTLRFTLDELDVFNLTIKQMHALMPFIIED